MGRWRLGTAAVVGVVTACLPGSGSTIQRPRGPSEALWLQMERGPHSGSLQDALVGVEVAVSTGDGAVKRTHRGNGLVIRCDGFVVVPTSLFSRDLTVADSSEEASGLAITIVTRPGMAGERRLTARRPRYERAGLGYSVVKIDDWHGPALAVEDPSSLAVGERLTVYSTEWAAGELRWQPLESRMAAAGDRPEGEEDARPGRRVFAEPLSRAPNGSLVCAPSGRAIGMVVNSGAEKGTREFAGFDALGLVTNCIVPEPPRPGGDSERPAASANETAPEMVKVSGGPVLLPTSVTLSQPDLERAKHACVAPFEIDKTEVTNAQFLAYWNSLPAERRRQLSFQNRHWPANWSKQGAPFPAEIADFPVTGVPLTGAMAYARSQRKRLPTPYEWCLAALGPQGAVRHPEWIDSLVRDRRNVWERACQVHLEYRDTTLARLQNNRGDVFQLPWIAGGVELLEASAWSKRILEQLTASIRRQYADPDYLAPVGTRTVDESPFGARDMLLNAPELVVSFPGTPTRGQERYMESIFPPAKLPQDSQFVPRKLELIAARDEYPDYPVLSRLYRRLINSPSTEDLVAWSSVAELQRILVPPAEWELRMHALQPSSYSGRPRGVALSALGRPPGINLWEHMPRAYRLEIGLPVPIDEVDRRIPMGPSLFYVSIGGFRCVRGL